jgi:hypothetical protein
LTPGAAERPKKIGQILLERRWITLDQLQRALQNQSVVGARIGTCLLELDALSEDSLLKALSEQRGVPAVGAEDLQHIPPELYAQLPARVARRCRAVPFRVLGNQIFVAALDADNLAIQDELAFVTAKRLKMHIANEARIYEALERGYGDQTPSRFQHLLERLNRGRASAAPSAPAAASEEDFLVWGPAPGAAPEPASRQTPPEPAPRPAPLLAADSPSVVQAAAPPASARLDEPVRAAEVPWPSPPEGARRDTPPPLGSGVTTPRPLTIPLAPEERARLGRPSGFKPLALAEVEARLLDPRDRDDVARTLLAYLAQTFSRVALLKVRHDLLVGWMGRGPDLSEEQLRRFTVSLQQPSVFAHLRQGEALYLGPLPSLPIHRDLARAWDGTLPRECLLLPVRLQGRLVTVVYADRGEAGLSTIDREALQLLAARTAAAFELCIRRAKRPAG